ncbi:MAG: DUF6350 family protein, partial [Propionibacteriaceae bacterium]|nr:DUF6350 family protein [Propionibacteriaceae bacterium]
MARENSLTQKVTVETYQAAPVVEVRPATMPWWVAGVGGAVVCALGGWAIIAALALVSQLAEGGIVVASAFRFSAQFWLLGHGGAFEQGTRLTLVPLGFTLVVALMLHGTAAYATKQAVLAAGPDCRRGLAVLKGWGTVTLAYAVIAVVVSFVIDPAELRAGLGAAALSAVAGFLGARKAARWDFHESWPVWARAVPRALLGGT